MFASLSLAVGTARLELRIKRERRGSTLPGQQSNVFGRLATPSIGAVIAPVSGPTTTPGYRSILTPLCYHTETRSRHIMHLASRNLTEAPASRSASSIPGL